MISNLSEKSLRPFFSLKLLPQTLKKIAVDKNWLRASRPLEDSGACNLNFLYKEKNIYIMDNHMAAAWAWAQEIKKGTRYKVFHIDRHYDLLTTELDLWLEEIRHQQIDLTSCTLDDYCSFNYESPNGDRSIQLFRWDNYLPIFLRLYTGLIDSIVFATHSDGMRDEEAFTKRWMDVNIWELSEKLCDLISNEESAKWILNIDLDFFFTGKGDNYQFLTDTYIQNLCNKIQVCAHKIDVITIALSPDFTNGWEQAMRISEMFSKQLGLGYRFPQHN